MSDNNQRLITIGLPTHNGEKTIKRTIDSIISQTFTNFQLIISDNGSTDSTSKICREYEKNENRIKYIQKKKGSMVQNFISLVEKADTKYFVWIADDDYWEQQFVEKNIQVLETNPKVVASISDIHLVGENIKSYYPNEKIPNLKDKQTKFKFVRPSSGTFDEKVKNILEFTWVLNYYSIFRTTELKNSLVYDEFIAWDWATVLNIIKFGDLHVLDEVLAFRDTGGITSKKSYIGRLKAEDLGWFKTYFPCVPLTIWCLKNLGFKNFIKNNTYFIYINFHNGKKIIRELIATKFHKIKF